MTVDYQLLSEYNNRELYHIVTEVRVKHIEGAGKHY